MMMGFNKRKRGSLTVEAVISFAVFVSFMFMLLSMVKISLVKITLENAVSETAKYIASASYPIGMFNDIAEDSNRTVEADITEFKLGKDIQAKGIEALFDSLFADSEASALKSIDDGINGIFGVITDAGTNMLKSVVLTGVENLITKEGSKVAGNIVSEVIDNSYVSIDKDNLTVTIAKLPVPEQTYNISYNTSQFTDMGLTKNDFNEDDVVIGVEYVYKLALPFLTTIDVKMREVAVEHAWVNGGAGNVTTRTEGLNFSDILDNILGGETVYVTNTGGKYHKENCYYLWGSKNEYKKSSAIVSGYRACKKCAP